MLHLIKLSENSGTPEVPRNLAIKFSRGKYLAFLDSDDLFTKTALEELTTLAEDYQADVVHNDEFYFFDDAKLNSATTEELLNTENHTVIKCNPNSLRLSEPTFAPNNFAERMQLWLNSDFHWATWALFCKRDFWISNRIEFPIMPVAGDILANFKCLCLAKKLLRVPNVFYIYRQREDSIAHNSFDLEKYFHRLLNDLNVGFNEFDKVMGKINFFDEHPEYRYAVLDCFFARIINDAWKLRAAYNQIHTFQLNALVRKEFQPDDAAFASFLFDTVNIQRLQIMRLQQELQNFKISKR